MATEGVLPPREQKRRDAALASKWGFQAVEGLDPARAEAIGLTPKVLEVGYAGRPELAGKLGTLPPLMSEPGVCRRFVHRTAELLLRKCERWREIEVATRETNEHYKGILYNARVRERGFRMANEIVEKMVERPKLLNVWERSCPGLLQSKTRELALQTEGTPAHGECAAEKLRIDFIYDAVVELKKIELDRPIRVSDIEEYHKVISTKMQLEQAKVLRLEAQLAKDLKEIGDGSETVLRFSESLEAALPSSELTLHALELHALPVEVFRMSQLTILDVSGNQLRELPPEVGGLKHLDKLYVNNNQLKTLPTELHRLSMTLTMVAFTGNPLNDELMQALLHGLPAAMSYLKTKSQEERGRKVKASPRPCTSVNLFSFQAPADGLHRLPSYHAKDGPSKAPPRDRSSMLTEQLQLGGSRKGRRRMAARAVGTGGLPMPQR